VRVGFLESRSDGIPGLASAGKAGDVLLENERIRVVVSAPEHALGDAASGGWIIDAAPIDGRDSWGQASFVLVDSIGIRRPRHTSVEIIHPSGSRSPGGVRFIGQDSRADGIRVDTEYLLAPGDSFVQVRTVYYWMPRGGIGGLVAIDRIAIGRTEVFLPGPGFLLEGEPAGGDTVFRGREMVSFAGDEVAYGWSSRACREVRAPSEGVVRVRLDPESPDGRRLVFERRFHVTGGGPGASGEGIEGEEAAARFSGTVRSEASRRPLSGATVEFRDESGLRAAASTGTDGAFRAELPPGSYTVVASAAGGGEGESKRARVGPGDHETIDLETEEPATIRFRIESERGTLLPGRLTIRDRSGRALARAPGRLPIPGTAAAADGLGTIRVPPGEYMLYASHGILYSIDERHIKLRPGEIADAAFRLARAVDPGGLAAVDLRVHTAAGPEASAAAEELASAALAEGLDALVFSDNGRVFVPGSDLAGGKILLIPGEEIVLEGIGRFGAFPLTAEEEIAPRGGYGAEGKAPGFLFSLLRAGPSLPLIQVHAPRRESTGYFANMRLDPVTGLSANIEFDPGFDLVEVADAQGIEEGALVLNDWFHLLNQGRRVLATGNSGARGTGDGGVGVPHNRVDREGFDTNRSGLIEALRAGRFFLTTGPILRFRANGTGRSGDLLHDGDGLVEIALRVEAAPWVDVETVRILANGSVLLDRKAGRREGSLVVDLRESLPIHRDTWLVAVAAGTRPLDPIYRGRRGERILPVAITNPIWVDFDGNGVFDPPGIR